MTIATVMFGLFIAAVSSSASNLPDVPVARYDTDKYPIHDWVPLRRTHDLYRAFVAGEGELQRGADEVDAETPLVGIRADLALTPLPWRVDEARRQMAYLISWRPHEVENDFSPRDSESLLGFVLTAGCAWCTPELELESGSRLRFEAIPLGPDPEVALELRLETQDGTVRTLDTSPSVPASLDGEAQTDMELDSGRARLCFRSLHGAIGIGEARVVAPEPPGADPRPRWVVLTVIDALRADVVEDRNAKGFAPTMTKLAHKGHWYRRAISAGCHTHAAVWPILMGRDLMRIDPLRRRTHLPIGSPLTQVYSQGNLFVSHLAEDAGYHAVFLGNNEYLHSIPAFSRFSSQGDPATGTVDTVRRLPELMKRYHDERIFLVYYISAPHGQSRTPRRLFEELGCGELAGDAKSRCSYDARVRHADESLDALQTALSELELDERTLQIVTADHGELFGDGFPLEAEAVSFQEGTFMGWWDAMDRGHGGTCHWNELNVPLFLNGPGIAPAVWTRSVSTLDIVPTLGKVLDLPIASVMDGEVLPLMGNDDSTEDERRFVSYGFCCDSIIQQDHQLIWWLGECRLRTKGQKTPLTHHTERWRLGAEIEKETTGPEELTREMAQHETWIRTRLPSGTHVFDLSGLPPGRLLIRVREGAIVDYGPSSTIHGLDAIESAVVEKGGSMLAMELEPFDGLFYVATSPPLTPITIELEPRPGHTAPLVFIGPMQLPLDVLGQTLDPSRDSAFYVSDAPPSPRVSPHPALRYWWQPYSRTTNPERRGEENMDFDRVLREWGYIR